ncbi:MAG: hypothetical protein NPIRA06_07450 [Nitrospirales bacterium]|nr:MAG: hypothetical protein NPIRA06_07450 [Nitrospirales bacterium]
MPMVWCDEGVDDEPILSYSHSSVVPLELQGKEVNTVNEFFDFLRPSIPNLKVTALSRFLHERRTGLLHLDQTFVG